jgi:hypothetical protein
VTDDFVTRLQLQLREAAEREERRGDLSRRFRRTSWRLTPMAAAAATLLAVVLGVLAAADWLSEPAPVQDRSPRVVATFELTEGAATIAEGFGSAWISGREHVLRVDPRTGAVTARIPAREAMVAAGVDAMWALEAPSDGRLLRIDPATNDAAAAIRLPEEVAGGPGGVIAEGDSVWVVSVEGALSIDTDRNRPGRWFPLVDATGEPRWIALGDGSLWVLARDDRLLRLDPASGEPAAVVPVRLAGAEFVVPSPEGLYLGTGRGEIARVDAGSGRLLWQRDFGTRVLLAPALGALWAYSSDPSRPRDRLAKLDPATGRTLTSVELPERTTDWIAPVGDRLWLSTVTGTVMVVQP